jgi:hypothetical protein
MRKIVAASLVVAAAAASGCSRGSANEDMGPAVSRNYPVGNFTELELAGAYDVDVKTGPNASVSARGPEKTLERLVVEVKGNTLHIHSKKEGGWFNMGWSRGGSGKVQLTVTVPALEAATLAGSGVIAIDKVQGDRFEGQIAGSGDLRVGTVQVDRLKVGIAGSGDANVGTGTARNAEYDIAGSGGVDGAGLAVEDLKISIAGSGGVKANATKTADVDIMGSGDVDLKGGAKCSISKAGSGDVRCS